MTTRVWTERTWCLSCQCPHFDGVARGHWTTAEEQRTVNVEGGVGLRGGVYFKVKSFMSSVKMFYFKNDTVWKQSWLLEKAEAVSWFCERSSIRECTNIHSKNCKQNSPETGTRVAQFAERLKRATGLCYLSWRGAVKAPFLPRGSAEAASPSGVCLLLISCHYQLYRPVNFWQCPPCADGFQLTLIGWVLVIQSCPTLCNPTDCSQPASSDRGILQARILEWVAIPFSRGSSQPRDQTPVSCIASKFFTIWATRSSSGR